MQDSATPEELDKMNAGEILGRLGSTAADPAGTVGSWKERTGRPVIGCLHCMPRYVPEEIIHAAGALPAGIWGAPVPISSADALMQSFTCTLARTALELALGGKLDVCDGFAFPSTCDAFQNLSEIWRASLPGRLHYDIVYPRFQDRRSAFPYLMAEIKKFRSSLSQDLGSEVTDEGLMESIAIYNRDRALLRALYRMLRDEPARLSYRELLDALTASFWMPRQEHAEALERLIETLPARQGAVKVGRRLFLAGIGPRPTGLVAVIEEAGGQVVGDDCGYGFHYAATEVDESADPVEALVRSILDAPAASTVHDGRLSRAEHLIALARECKAEAVVLINLKFCDPEAFDFPDLKKTCAEANLPVLLIETELTAVSNEQARTRVDAFLESL